MCRSERVKKIPIDVSGCRNEGDFYDLLLSGLKAPGWHGRNLDALWDSITSDINGVSPPFLVEVTGHRQASEEVALLVSRVRWVSRRRGRVGAWMWDSGWSDGLRLSRG